MTAPNSSRETDRNWRKVLSVAAGAAIAATLAAAPAFAQMHDGHRGHSSGGHARSQSAAAPSGTFRSSGGWQGQRGGTVTGGYRGNYSGGWNRGYAGGAYAGGNRSWGYRGYRNYGPAFVGFGYYTDPFWAAPYIGLSAWNWAAYDALNEAEIRAQEDAFITATSAPLSDPIAWNDGNVSGTVTPTREGHTQDGRLCREFQQQVTIAGKREQAFGTACQQSDGSWQIVDQDNAQE